MKYLVYTPSTDRAERGIGDLSLARITAMQFARRGTTHIYCLEYPEGANEETIPECVGEVTVEKTGMGFAWQTKGRTK